MKNLFLVCACFPLLFAGCTIIQYTPLQGPVGFFKAPPVTVGEPFIIAQSEYGLQHGFYAFPVVRKMGDGTWIVAYASGDTGVLLPITVDEQGELIRRTRVRSPAISTDDGKTWEYRAPPGMPPDALDDAPMFSRLTSGYRPEPISIEVVKKDGSRIAFSDNVSVVQRRFFRELRESWEGVGLHMVSSDGVNWSPARDTLYSLPAMQKSLDGGSAIRIHGDGVELADGTILLAAYSSHLTPYRHESHRGYASIVLASTDGGNTFTTRSVIASGRNLRARPTTYMEGPGEPGMALLPSGELFAVMRTWSPFSASGIGQSAPMLAARSEDGGLTWKTWTFPYSGVRPRVLVTSDGSLVCTFGRPGNTLVVSSDGGRTWGWTHTLSPPNWPTTGYTDMVEIGPNRLLVVYDLRDFDAEKMRITTPGDGVNVVVGRIVEIGEAAKK